MTYVNALARRRRPVPRLAALACAILLPLAGCGEQERQRSGASTVEDAVVTPEDGASAPADDVTPGPADDLADPDPDQDSRGDEGEDSEGDEAAPEPRPVAVEIPAIGVDAELVGLGLNDDGSMEVPDFGLAGWYEKGPAPGAVGPSVIAAHYDSTDGPDVFYKLDALQPGDEIHVHREDGSTASFVVEGLERHPKEELPGDRIWAASEKPELTLITCGGVFDESTRHYTDNVIAYATAAPTGGSPRSR